MKHYVSIVAVCLLPACGGGGGGGSGTSVSTLSPTGVASRPALPSVPANNTFSGLLNNSRMANGAAPVAFDARLGQAAQGHADDMLRQDYFDHIGKNKSTPTSRAAAAGYKGYVTENIAWGYQSEESVMDGWTSSPGHHRNNIDTKVNDFGLGKAGSGQNKYWVLMLGRER